MLLKVGERMIGREKAERILWNYRQNVKNSADFKKLWATLKSVQGQDYGATHTVNGVSDPVSETVNRKISLERKIVKLEREIQAVESLIDSLPVEELRTWQMRGILTRRYIEHKEPDMVMRELGITKATYYRRNNELIARAREYTE